MKTPVLDHFSRPAFQYNTTLLRMGLYAWVIVCYSLLIPASNDFWGELVFFSREKTLISNYLLFSIFPWLHKFPSLLPVVCVCLAFFGLIKRKSTVVALLIYYIVISLDNVSFPILDGGNNLAHLLLFYNIFFITQGSTTERSVSSKTALLASNCAFSISQIQVLLVYIVAGLTKVTGELWPKGVAIYYVFNIDNYTLPWLKNFFMTCHEAFIVLPTYLALVFQLSFPYMIWNKRVKGFYIFIGAMIHFGISFFMGLVSFGLVMCVSYICFYGEDKSQRMVKIIDDSLERFCNFLISLFRKYKIRQAQLQSENKIP